MCPERSVLNYQSMLRNIREKRISKTPADASNHASSKLLHIEFIGALTVFHETSTRVHRTLSVAKIKEKKIRSSSTAFHHEKLTVVHLVQKLRSPLCHQKVCKHFHKSPPLVPELVAPCLKHTPPNSSNVRFNPHASN
jgi:hypothetical protein